MIKTFSCGLFLMGILFVGTIWAGDMQLTLDDGREVLLHDDSTWGYAKFTITEGDEEDMYITVNKGKVVHLRPDNTWSFTTKVPRQQKISRKEYPSANATGKAQRSNLDDAVKAATNEALEQLSKQLLRFTSRKKGTRDFLVACIRNEIGGDGAEVDYKPSWSATAKVSLTSMQVRNVIDCVKVQEKAEAAAKEEATTEKRSSPQ